MSYGTGLHRYWYLRLILLIITFFIPLGLTVWGFVYYPDVIRKYSDIGIFVVLGWVLFVVIAIILELKTESVLEKKKGHTDKHVQITNSTMDKESAEIFNSAFKQFDTLFKNAGSGGNVNKANNLVCPKCGGNNITKMDTGNCVCLNCECIFTLK